MLPAVCCSSLFNGKLVFHWYQNCGCGSETKWILQTCSVHCGQSATNNFYGHNVFPNTEVLPQSPGESRWVQPPGGRRLCLALSCGVWPPSSWGSALDYHVESDLQAVEALQCIILWSPTSKQLRLCLALSCGVWPPSSWGSALHYPLKSDSKK